MKEYPPDIDIARELDIFSKAHFTTNDNNDHQQQNHTINSTLAAEFHQDHYTLGSQLAFTAPTSVLSSSSTSFLHPSTATTRQPAPNHSIAASNNFTARPPKNSENLSLYENYPSSYHHATTDSTHSHSGSPHSGYTTPTPFPVTHHSASSNEQKQQTFDQFMSMMNMVDQRLQQLGSHGNSESLFSSVSATTHASTPSSPTIAFSGNRTLPTITNAPLFSHSQHQPTNSITTTATIPVVSSSTPTRGRGRRISNMPLVDRKGKKPANKATSSTTATAAAAAMPTASSSYPTNKVTTPHHTQVSDSNSEDHSDLDDDDDDDDDDEQPPGSLSSDPHDRERYARDKRRRNTEASARFRIKKKMREQALRRTADEMTLRSQHLQQRVHELEKEIKWLRELIVEKKQSQST